MQTGFQLGLELTNVLNPLTSVISSLGSLALAKAIKNGGSDALTEAELANYLGRNRIDPSMQVHFRHFVGKSEQKPLSRYVDIFLASGPGPTVQNALQDRELLSMVIQLSLLTFAHENDALAQGIVEAMERNLREFKADTGKVPDFSSLCGTLRVCKRETAGFQWSHLYHAAETKIRSCLGEERPSRHKTSQIHSIVERTLPFPVLQTLFMGLYTLQHFPEERRLDVGCSQGIITAIIWCHHVLGLSVKLRLEDTEIYFGNPPANVFIRESSSRQPYASLLHPNSQHEPLFTVAKNVGDPVLRPDLRRRAKGFAQEYLKNLDPRDETLDTYRNWIMHRSLLMLEGNEEYDGQAYSKQLDPDKRSKCAQRPTLHLSGFTKAAIIRAGAFLFDLDQVQADSSEITEARSTAPKGHQRFLSSLVVLVLSFSKVQPEDLETCGSALLSVQALDWLSDDEVQSILCSNLSPAVSVLTKSFKVLSRLFEGYPFSKNLNNSTTLVSACGWSLYFNSLNLRDPAEVFASTLRIVQGVPARNEIRKTRIVDGPTDVYFSLPETQMLKNSWNKSVSFLPGVSTTKRGQALVGYREPDAFEISQMFERHTPGGRSRKDLLGFRRMVELCSHFFQFPPCDCDGKNLSFGEVARSYMDYDDIRGLRDMTGIQDTDNISAAVFSAEREIFSAGNHKPSFKTGFPDSKRFDPQWFKDSPGTPNGKVVSPNGFVLLAQTGTRQPPFSQAWLVSVSNNPAARWMQVWDISFRLAESFGKGTQMFLRGPGTCPACVFKAIIPTSLPSDNYHEEPTALVLL